MANKSTSSSFRKWLGGVATSVIVAVLVWWLTHAGGVLNPIPVTPTAEMPAPIATPPHAPVIENDLGVSLFDETTRVLTVKSGNQITLPVTELWTAPLGADPNCTSGVLALTWIVRRPYPEGGKDLEILGLVPMGQGRTRVLARGSTGSITVGWCDEVILFNTSLQDYTVEIRYASGLLP